MYSQLSITAKAHGTNLRLQALRPGPFVLFLQCHLQKNYPVSQQQPTNGLSVLVCLLTALLSGMSPLSEQFLNIVRLFGTMASGNIRQKESKPMKYDTRGELFALFTL